MRNYIVLFLGCLLLHVAGTSSLPLIDRDEPRFAEAAREMRERADFIVPYFNNQFRFDKPPLTYWFQVASYRLFGENDFAARFPKRGSTSRKINRLHPLIHSVTIYMADRNPPLEVPQIQPTE